MSYDHTDKRVTNRDLHDEGYLLEANRRFFHPLGLELRALPPYSTEESRLEVADLRDVEGGPTFGWDEDDGSQANHCRNNIDRELKLRRFAREEKLQRGDVVQPIPPGSTPEPDEQVWLDEEEPWTRHRVSYREYSSADKAVDAIRRAVETQAYQAIDERRIEEYTEMLANEDPAPQVDHPTTFTLDLARVWPPQRPVQPFGGYVDSDEDGDWLEVRHDGPV